MSSSKKSDPAQTLWEMTGYCPGQIHLQCAMGHRPGLSHPQTSGHKPSVLYVGTGTGDQPAPGRGATRGNLLWDWEDTHKVSSAFSMKFDIWKPSQSLPTQPEGRGGGHRGKCSESLSLSQCHFRPPSLLYVTTCVILHFLVATLPTAKRRGEINIHSQFCLTQYHFNMY